MSSDWSINSFITDPISGFKRWKIHDIKGGKGKSGMGVVYLCYDHKFHEPVAIKTFQDEYIGNVESRKRFLIEAQTWVDLEKHPNIVMARYVREIDERPYIFLEYIVGDQYYGADLSGWIRKDGLNLSLTLNFAIQFCDGMIYAAKKFQELGKTFIHRDIKPGNIMITFDKKVKITDFGLVRAAQTINHDDQGLVLTKNGKIMGTPPYMSPEQCQGKLDDLDIRSDIYSFGCVLFEMLTKRLVFKAYSLEEFIHCHIYDPPQNPKDINPNIPDDIDHLVMKCLNKRQEDRYQDFKELRADLSSIYFRHSGKTILPLAGIKLQAWEWVSKSFSLASLGRYEEALQSCDQAIKLDPGNAPAFSNKGFIYNILGDHAKALEYCNRAVALDFQFAAAWNNHGNSLANLGQHEQAIESFKHVLAIDTNHINAWFNLGNSWINLNQYEEGLKCYNKVLEINPDDVDALFNKGLVLAELNKHGEAIQYFEQIRKIDPSAKDILNYLGASFVSIKKFDKALECFNEVLRLDPANEMAKRGRDYCVEKI